MRFVVPLKNIEEIPYLSQLGVDAFLVMPEGFARNEVAAFSLDEIKGIRSLTTSLSKYLYVSFNFIVHESTIEALDLLLKDLSCIQVDAYVIYDLSVYPLLKKYHLESKCIYQPGTLTTNQYDLDFYQSLGIKGVTISREITLEEVQAIANIPSQIEYSLVGHGYLEMFYSRRPLLTNYFLYHNRNEVNPQNDVEYRLIEELRKDDLYPILENHWGTSIFRSHKLQSFQESIALQSHIEDFFFERIFMENDEFYDSVTAYIHPENQKTFLDRYRQSYDSGYYYRKTGRSKEDIV